MGTPSRAEVESAFRKYLKLGAEEHDWNAWADLFTEDARYVEVQYGTFHGREEIRRWIVEIMKTVPDMYFPPPQWHMIEGDRVVFYLDNVLPNPEPQGPPLAFPSVSILRYRDGLWCYEEDIYDVRASLRAKEQFRARRGAS
jgi:hypothetical protein